MSVPSSLSFGAIFRSVWGGMVEVFRLRLLLSLVSVGHLIGGIAAAMGQPLALAEKLTGIANRGGTDQMHGTKQALPVVGSVAALMSSRSPAISFSTIRA